MPDRQIKIGTRGSALALAQVELCSLEFSRHHPDVKLVIVPIVTTGDRRQSLADARPHDKKEWIFEIEQALIAGDIDLALHSGKDVPIEVHAQTTLLPLLTRGCPNDVFVSRKALEGQGAIEHLSHLPPGSSVGTSSLRRHAQLRVLAPKLDVREFRGNIPTRLEKLRADNSLSGIVIAQAALNRLKIDIPGAEQLSTDVFLPAVNQGILVGQVRNDDAALIELLQKLVDPNTHAAWLAERNCIRVLGADCHSSVGVYASVQGDVLTLRAEVFHPSLFLPSTDSSSVMNFPHVLEAQGRAAIDNADSLGADLASNLLAKGAAAYLSF